MTRSAQDAGRSRSAWGGLFFLVLTGVKPSAKPLSMSTELQRVAIPTELELQLCGADGIELADQKFVPNRTRAYFGFKLSHAFPVETVYGSALMPAVIERSYHTIIHQNLNREHMLAFNHPPQSGVNDKVIGAVVAASFPKAPYNGWKLTTAAESPCITGIAAVFKQCQGVSKILGDHQTGRKKHTVSMEVLWPLEECGFALSLNDAKPIMEFTPDYMLKAGYEYIPWDSAPDDLRATWSQKKSRVVARWKGRKVTILMGGLDGAVDYSGVGIVAYGAEPPAKIVRMAASADNPLEATAAKLGSIFESVFANKTQKSIDGN